jgi:alanine racemase
LDIPKSLSATGGILLGSDYHFDLTRPGVGLYGGLPFEQARAVAKLNIPIIQTREVDEGETVGYANTWRAPTPRRIATVSAGYADGIIRAMGDKTVLYTGDVACPIVGRISMDLIGVDVTLLTQPVESLELLNDRQTIDVLAENAGTIGYEILTSLGGRYQRRYAGDMG